MMPSGHMRSGLEVAALLRRDAALRLLVPPWEEEPLPGTGGLSSGGPRLWAGAFSEFKPDFTLLVWTEICSSSPRSWNMRRSSSSRAMSPQKAAVGGGGKGVYLDHSQHRLHWNPTVIPENEQFCRFKGVVGGAKANGHGGGEYPPVLKRGPLWDAVRLFDQQT